jgi:hypothetical protein
MKSEKTKAEIFKEAIELFITEEVHNGLLINYLDAQEDKDDEGDATFHLQAMIVNFMKPEILDWCTGIGIIEAVNHLYNTALENGNLINKLKE